MSDISLMPMSRELCRRYYKGFTADPDLYMDMSLFQPFQYSDGRADAYFKRQMQKERLYFAIMDGNTPVGEITLKDINPEKTECTLGIHLQNDSVKGKGIGTRAEQLILQCAFKTLRMETVFADAVLKNKRSQHVLEKVGFRFVRQDETFMYYEMNRETYARLYGAEFYYFSGTGNTLAAAKTIAASIDAKLIAIPSVMDKERIDTRAETVGIAFPSYLAATVGVPLIVERFVQKLAHPENLNIFIVCTCGGYETFNALPSLDRLERLIKSRGGRILSAHSVRLPMNNLDYRHIPIPIETDSAVILRKSEKKLDKISRDIASGRHTRFRHAKKLLLLLLRPLFASLNRPILNSLKEKAQLDADADLNYADVIPLTDRSITVDDRCIGCGVCATVCPVNNIKIIEGRPTFQHGCEMCFACDEWCPQNAIHHWSRASGVKYHHPDCDHSDMILRENQS